MPARYPAPCLAVAVEALARVTTSAAVIEQFVALACDVTYTGVVINGYSPHATGTARSDLMLLSAFSAHLGREELLLSYVRKVVRTLHVLGPILALLGPLRLTRTEFDALTANPQPERIAALEMLLVLQMSNNT